MVGRLAAKFSAASNVKSLRRRGISFWRSMAIFIVSVIVVVLVMLSLWVSIGAIIEKVKISRGMSQVIDVVDMSRRVATAEHDFGSIREDILVRLARMKQIQAAGDDTNGLRTLVNPWGGTLTAVTVPINLFRVETVVPSRVCKRMINLLTENPNSLGIKQIDAKGSDEALRQIYSEAMRDNLTRDEISAGCHSDQLVILDLTFTLR
jgi:hypothetical protein